MASYKSLKSANAPAIPTGFIIPWSHNSIPNGFFGLRRTTCEPHNLCRFVCAYRRRLW